MAATADATLRQIARMPDRRCEPPELAELAGLRYVLDTEAGPEGQRRDFSTRPEIERAARQGSVDDLKASPARSTCWDGVRNYQARNFMRDQMKVGDKAFFYHSNCDEPGITGIVEVSAPAHPDETQFDRRSDYYDAKSRREAPRWFNVDVRALRKTRLVSLAELRKHARLGRMRLLQPGNRLSITPVSEAEWKYIAGKLL